MPDKNNNERASSKAGVAAATEVATEVTAAVAAEAVPEDSEIFPGGAEYVLPANGDNVVGVVTTAIAEHEDTLIEIGLVAETGERGLTVDARIDRIAERSQELLSDESRQMLLQLLSRRKQPELAKPADAA
mgnify:CR=1 FL=1